MVPSLIHPDEIFPLIPRENLPDELDNPKTNPKKRDPGAVLTHAEVSCSSSPNAEQEVDAFANCSDDKGENDDGDHVAEDVIDERAEVRFGLRHGGEAASRVAEGVGNTTVKALATKSRLKLCLGCLKQLPTLR
jgi:hypothetical protein